MIYQEVINLLLGLPFRLYLNILKTEKILQFWDKKRRAWLKLEASTLKVRVVEHTFLLDLYKNRVNREISEKFVSAIRSTLDLFSFIKLSNLLI